MGMAIFVRQQTGSLFEHAAHIGGIMKTGSDGDFIDRQIGINQQCLGGFKVGQDDLVVNGAAQRFLEFHLQRSPTDADRMRYIIDLQRFVGVLANKFQRGNHIRVVDCEDVG